MWFKRKEKVVDPIIHDEESNFSLSSGVHILNKCQNVSLSGNAIVLESFDCSFSEIGGKAKVQMAENADITTLGGKAKIGLFKSGKIRNSERAIRNKINILSAFFNVIRSPSHESFAERRSQSDPRYGALHPVSLTSNCQNRK